MFMSLFSITCFDSACLLFFWHLSRVFRSALIDVCVLCSISAITACVLESLQFCLLRGRSWDVRWCVCCAAGAFLGPCVFGECVPWCVGTPSFSCLIVLALSCSDHLVLAFSFCVELFGCLARGHSVLYSSSSRPAGFLWGLFLAFLALGPVWSNVLVQSGPMYAHVFSMCLCLSVFVPVCVYGCVIPRSFAGFVASFAVGVR